MKRHEAQNEKIPVINYNIGDYSKTQLFFRLAVGYTDSSHRLFSSMLANELPKSFAHAQVAHFFLDHALELFLKGALLKKGENLRNTHHLEQLYNRYCKLYPNNTYNFTGRIQETITDVTDSPHSEFPRYPVNTNGEIWAGYNAYTLENWLEQSKRVKR